jgi:hypothetical protein
MSKGASIVRREAENISLAKAPKSWSGAASNRTQKKAPAITPGLSDDHLGAGGPGGKVATGCKFGTYLGRGREPKGSCRV